MAKTSQMIRMDREILYLSIDAIKVNSCQQRRFLDIKDLEELANSIREYGVLQPISVRFISSCCYEIIAGERRLRASKMIGLTIIPAIVVSLSERESAILAMIENMQRSNLNYLEEAEGFYSIMARYNFTQDELAVKVGKSQSIIANKMRILKLSSQIHRILIENNLSEKHARALLRLDSEEKQLTVLEKVVSQELTVKKTEEYINSLLKHKFDDKKNISKVKTYVRDVRIFTNTIKSTVEIMNDSGIKADYNLEEKEEGYEIKITVKY